MGRSVAVILAAGSGKRMNKKIPKQYIAICGRPVVYYCLVAFENSLVDDIILVVGDEEQEYCQKEIVDKYEIKKVRHIIAGGKERYDSVYAGICACDRQYKSILIHDGARPMISTEIINNALGIADTEKACLVAVPAKDTIKIVDEHGAVSKTLDRSFLWNAQTPQAFSYEVLKNAYEKLFETRDSKDGITDDSMVVEKMLGIKSKVCMGDYRNIKITTSEDLIMATQYLEKKI